MAIPIKNEQEMEIMRKSGHILGTVLEETLKQAKPGVTTHDLDQFAENMIRDMGGEPGFKGFHGFPATLCTAIDEVIVHGIPRKDEVIKEGDLLTIDCGVRFKGMNTDAARSIVIGQSDKQTEKMVKDAYRILSMAIDEAKPGNRVSDISIIIEQEVNKAGYHILRDLTGHGIGYDLHEEPMILNFWDGSPGPLLKPGMTVAIEPIFAIGTGKMKTLDDGWTIVTADGSKSIQVEQTIAITQNGPEILTKV